MTVGCPKPSSCSIDDFFNQSEIPHDVRSLDFEAWKVRNRLDYAELVKKYTDSGLLAALTAGVLPSRWLTRAARLADPNYVEPSPLPCSDADRVLWRSRIELAYPSEALALSLLNPAGSQRGGGVGVEQGLSNAPYLHAEKSKRVELLIRPASTLFRLRHPRKLGGCDFGHTLTKRVAKRGRVREFSQRSRLGLQLLAADLQVVVRKPDLMVTLTYPGNWETATTDCVCGANQGSSDVPPDSCICPPSGKVCKVHLRAFRERLTRYLKLSGVSKWGALWFLEFQRRGAPHFHLLLFGFGFSLVELSDFKAWLSTAWAEIVRHPDSDEYAKHLKAGTRAEWCKAEHFGYALKYAAKLEQKLVPVEFSDIGRFWGCWNSPLQAPALRAWYVSAADLREVGTRIYHLLVKHSKSFAFEFSGACLAAAEGDYTFSYRVFGRESSEYFTGYGLPAG